MIVFLAFRSRLFFCFVHAFSTIFWSKSGRMELAKQALDVRACAKTSLSSMMQACRDPVDLHPETGSIGPIGAQNGVRENYGKRIKQVLEICWRLLG